MTADPLIAQEPEQNPAIVDLLDCLTQAAYGTTRQAAHQRNACIRCQRTITAQEFASWPLVSQREYGISGICDPCWHALFPPDSHAE